MSNTKKAPKPNMEELQTALQALIAQGQKEGMIKSADLNALLEKMDLTPEKIEADWNDKYVPSLKWELIESKLEEISPVEPTNNQIVDYIKDILRRNDRPVEGETKEQAEDRLEKAARSIAADRKNIGQVVDRLYADNLSKLFKDQVKPEVEKVSAKEFAERAKEQ